jgi:uncharacterized membrane protein YvbJ
MAEAQNCVAGETVTFSWDTKIMYDSIATVVIKVLLYVFFGIMKSNNMTVIQIFE